ncbi:MAG: hypothetical protein ABIO67_08760, partial [Mycobacteriales bacterium]
MTGRYLLSDHDGPYAVEDFRSADESDGWCYRATRRDPETEVFLGELELVVATDGRVLRLEQSGGGWLVRGGVVGGDALWRRGDQEHAVPAHGFTGSSPAYAVVCSRLAAARGEGSLRLIAVHDGVLATATVDQVWTQEGDTWTCVDRSTGEA